MSGSREPLAGYKHICPLCGKEFWGFADWVYKKKRRIQGTIYTWDYYCSWSCVRRIERAEETKKSRRTRVGFI